MPPIRVLQVMPAMDAGGMETFVMNVYRTIDREKVQFDFLYHYDKPCFFDDDGWFFWSENRPTWPNRIS